MFLFELSFDLIPKCGQQTVAINRPPSFENAPGDLQLGGTNKGAGVHGLTPSLHMSHIFSTRRKSKQKRKESFQINQLKFHPQPDLRPRASHINQRSPQIAWIVRHHGSSVTKASMSESPIFSAFAFSPLFLGEKGDCGEERNNVQHSRSVFSQQATVTEMAAAQGGHHPSAVDHS